MSINAGVVSSITRSILRRQVQFKSILGTFDEIKISGVFICDNCY